MHEGACIISAVRRNSVSMELPSFIRKVGVDECAILFDAKPGAVKAWMYGERVPKRTTARIIEERTRDHPAGRVRFADCYPVTQ